MRWLLLILPFIATCATTTIAPEPGPLSGAAAELERIQKPVLVWPEEEVPVVPLAEDRPLEPLSEIALEPIQTVELPPVDKGTKTAYLATLLTVVAVLVGGGMIISNKSKDPSADADK